ncbi:MAG: hypothetical protein AAFQ40_11355 [Cyanobacteria bacterium J06623_5]
MISPGYPIYFFLPAALWPENLPHSPDENWPGYGLGMYAWTIQTYLRLRSAGVVCELTDRLPDEGIVLCHSNVLRAVQVTPAARRFVICMKAEAPRCAIATMHVVQNPTEASLAGDCYFLPHWPQPHLVPRDPSRGDRFETVAFFGHQNSLAPELMSHAWQVALAERGLRSRAICNTNPWYQYETVDASWNDYHDVDAVVAVRSFSALQRTVTGGFSNKPATKLYNAWLGGAIPVLGAESAYRKTGQPGRDYVEVVSFSDLLDSLDRLKGNAIIRQTFRARGQEQSELYKPEKIVRKWQVFLEAVAIPSYIEWCEYSDWQRTKAFSLARAASFWDRAVRRGQQQILRSFSNSQMSAAV